MQELVNEYNATNSRGDTVNLTRQQWSPLFDAFVVGAGAGEAPDILAMHPQEMTQFIVLDLLLPLDDILAGSDILKRDNYSGQAWDAHNFDGVQYGIPLDLHMHGLYYNLDLFEAAGLDPLDATVGLTGEEFLEIARQLTVDANGNHPGDDGFDADNIVQYAVNQHTNHHAFFQWWALYRQQGGELLSADGKSCAMDIGKSAAAWQWQQDLVYKHMVAPQGQTDYPADFYSGRTAMLIDGPWRMVSLEQQAEETGLKWASAPYPVVFDQPSTWSSGHSFTLPADADPANQDAALAFLEWLGANSAAWATSGQLPTFKSVMESDSLAAMYGREAFLSMMPYSQIFPSTSKYNEIFASNAPTPMMVMAQSVILEQADPTAASETACAEIDNIVK
jgi:multiple sugar transport system substrate-binding protein